MPEVTDEFIERLIEVEDKLANIPQLATRVGTLEKTVKSSQIVTMVMAKIHTADDFAKVAFGEKILKKWIRNNRRLSTLTEKIFEKVRTTGKVSYSDNE